MIALKKWVTYDQLLCRLNKQQRINESRIIVIRLFHLNHHVCVSGDGPLICLVDILCCKKQFVFNVLPEEPFLMKFMNLSLFCIHIFLWYKLQDKDGFGVEAVKCSKQDKMVHQHLELWLLLCNREDRAWPTCVCNAAISRLSKSPNYKVHQLVTSGWEKQVFHSTMYQYSSCPWIG